MNITNKDALVFLSDENCLLDTSVDKIEIHEIKNEKIISVIFKMRAKSHYKNIKITFAGVKEYQFYWSNIYNSDIESYKFFMDHNELFYISLSPLSEEAKIEEGDQDFILCNTISIEIL